MGDSSWRNSTPHHETWRNPGPNNAPYPPDDPELRSSIEQTAATCAANGPEFEAFLRQKQSRNPNYAFLNGGPYSDYYQYALRMSIQQSQGPPGTSFGGPGMPPSAMPSGSGPGTSYMGPGHPNMIPHGTGPPPQFQSNIPPPGIYPPGHPPPRQNLPSLMDTPEVLEIKKEIEDLRQKITDSENNLLAHKAGLDDILQTHLKTTIRTEETAKIDQLLLNLSLDSSELVALLEKMSSSKCSKDTISHAKKWIFENCRNDQLREAILTFLLNKVKDPSSSDFLKLHILYLINDWAYHCQRKKEDNQMKMLSRYVPKMYAYCMEETKSNELKEKLEGKLLGEWEGRGYFAPTVFKQLLNTSHIVKTDREIEMSTYHSAKESLKANIMATFEGYEQQHDSFAVHIQSQIDEKLRKIDELIHGPPKVSHPSLMTLDIPNPNSRSSRFDQTPEERQQKRESMGGNDRWRDGDDIDGHPFDKTELKPKKSYMALPAGIMVAQVPIDHFEYREIDPENLEMPPKVPPSQRLLAAKESFYKGLNLDSVVTIGEPISDDWDIANFPVDFLERKSAAKKKFLQGLKDVGEVLNDVITNYPNEEEEAILKKEEERKWNLMVKNINDKVEAYYADKEPDADYDRERSRSRSRSRGRSRSRSRSRSSSRSSRGRRSRQRRSRSSSNSSENSGSSSSSSSNSSSRSNSPRKSERRERSRADSRSPQRERAVFKRSLSPEFVQPAFGFRAPTAPNAPLPSDNKGAQLMSKMGWSSGRGLGASEDGIVDPVDGGEVRDRADQFRGFGSQMDAFEQFRRNRSGTYHEKGAQFRGRNA